MNDILTFVGSHLFEVVSVVGVISALSGSTWLNVLTSRAIRAQSFVDVLDLEIQSEFQKGILAVTALKDYTNYEDFDENELTDTKEAVYNAVVFLNFMAVLGEEGYLHIQDAWDVYFWSYRTCSEKLLPWWLAEQRVHQPHVFPSFERACSAIMLVNVHLVSKFDKRIGSKHLRKYQRTSRVKRGKLRPALSYQVPPAR